MGLHTDERNVDNGPEPETVSVGEIGIVVATLIIGELPGWLIDGLERVVRLSLEEVRVQIIVCALVTALWLIDHGGMPRNLIEIRQFVGEDDWAAGIAIGVLGIWFTFGGATGFVVNVGGALFAYGFLPVFVDCFCRLGEGLRRILETASW